MISKYIEEVIEVAKLLNQTDIEHMLAELKSLKARGGRLFILGVGGSAANASHSVNDFRKIAGIEAYAPTDNVALLTAWTNDQSWEAPFYRYLEESNLNEKDAILVLSVGGGSEKTSVNLISAINVAKMRGATVLGIVSRDGGFTKERADVCVLIPVVNPQTITPHAESFQAVVWHYLANNI